MIRAPLIPSTLVSNIYKTHIELHVPQLDLENDDSFGELLGAHTSLCSVYFCKTSRRVFRFIHNDELCNLHNNLPHMRLTLKILISLQSFLEWEDFVDDWFKVVDCYEAIHIFELFD